jgi:hypothetical protein
MSINNYDILVQKIKSVKIRSNVKNYISEVNLNNDKKLFILENTYPDLINSLKVKFKKDEYIEKINELIDEDVFVRLFIFIDFYNLIQKNYKENCDFAEYNETLYIIKKFGFSKNMSCKDDFYIKMFKYYRSAIENAGNRFILEQYVLEPLRKIFKILNIELRENYAEYYLDMEDLKQETVQNFFIYWQHHNFYEDYVSRRICYGKKFEDYIFNPIILFNPCYIDSQNRIEGYFELDGSLIIDNNNVIMLEFKNTKEITLEHVTNFLGKCYLLENIYGIKVIKRLYSSGKNRIWKDLDKYVALGLELYSEFQ